MKLNLHKYLIITFSVGIACSVFLFGNTILTTLITPLPPSFQSCIKEKFSNEVKAQDVCANIAVAGTDSVAVWTSDSKLRESKMYISGTWPDQNVGIGISNPAAKFDVTGGYMRARQSVPDSNNAPGSGRGVELVATAGQGYLQSYDRGGTGWQPLNIGGSPINLSNGNVAVTTGNLSVGQTSAAERLEVNGSILLQNQGIIKARDTGGTIQNVLYGRWSDNATYLDAGTGGLNLRVNSGGITGLNINESGYATLNQAALYFPSNAVWSGDATANAGKIQYHAERFYMNAGTSSNRIVQFRRGASDVSYIDNAGKYVGTASNAVNWWSTSHEGTYYLVNNWNNTYWRITSNHPSGVSVQHATVADSATTASNANTVGGKTFNWSGQNGQPAYYWGSNDGVNQYVWQPMNIQPHTSYQTGGAYGAGYFKVGVYHTLSSNSNGFLYLGDQNLGIYGGRGFAADTLYANTRVQANEIRIANGADPHVWIAHNDGVRRFALRTSDGVGHGATWQGGWKDLAENMHAGQGETHEAGDVVMLDGTARNRVVKTKNPYEAGAVGIISTNPGFLMNAPSMKEDGSTDGDRGKPVSLSGRTPTKVSIENGPIQIGDPLTSSSVPGVAMKATKAGRIIGYAMENFPYTEKQGDPKLDAMDQMEYHTEFSVEHDGQTYKAGKVSVFVNASYFAGTQKISAELEKEVAKLKEENKKQNDIISNQQKQLDALEKRLQKLESN